MQVALIELLFNILNIVASIVGGAMLLRFWTQVAWVRPPAALSKFIYTVTDWWVLRVRRTIPAKGKFDLASLLGTFLIAFLLQVAIVLISILLRNFSETSDWLPVVGGILISAIFTVLSWVYWGGMALLILGALFSWINPHAPMAPYVQALAEPILRPIRNVLPIIAGIDFSPLVAMLLLQLLYRLLQIAIGNLAIMG